MHKVDLQQAKAQLLELVEDVARGEDVVITRSDGSSFRIIPVEIVDRTPKFGSAKELIKIADDFDDPIEGFEEYAP